MKQSIVIVDGNSLINRAFFAMSDLRNSKGLYTGGVYGLTSMVLSLIEQFNPTHFCVAFDMKGPTFRHLSYDAYKGTRKGMPDELAMQMPVVKEILDALKIPRVELQGYEADDLIGTIGKLCLESGLDVHVVTGDKDALQLVALGANVHITKKGITQLKCYTDDDVMEELGVHSNQVIDYKGLSGDTSDNIPGIPGVGPKTAAKLLETFGTVENLVLNADQIDNKRIKGLVEEYSEQALMSKRLATIFTEVPIEFDLSNLEIIEPDYDFAVHTLKSYELNTIIVKLKKNETIKPQEHTFELVSASKLSSILSGQKSFGFKLFYDNIGIVEKKLVGAVIITGEDIFILDESEDITQLKTVFENSSIHKYGYDLKNEYLFLMNEGIDLNGVTFDGFIAAYLIDPASKNYDLSDILYENAIKITSSDDFIGKGAKKVSYSSIAKDDLYLYMAGYIQGVHQWQKIALSTLEKNDLMHLFETVEVPLVKVLSDIEFTGFRVDIDEVDTIDRQLIEKIAELETSIYQLAGETFNINSPKQLGVILFEKLELPSGKKTKTGYSTGHDVLEKLAHKHPIIDEIIEYRTYTKLKSTYIDGLRQVIDMKDCRVHTSLNQTIAVTGRLSSTDPNLQNIPIKLPYGRKIRRFFVADPGCLLLDADYSQIELRVLAHLAQDPKLIDAFNHDRDIHTLTASQVFKINESEVTSLQRSRAKEVNFGIVYGMGDFGLSESLNISRKDAKTYIENYFESYPRVKGFMEEIIDQCKTNGYVETILRRKRAVADINHSNFMLRSAAERIARNTPIQGSAADIIKLAMINVYNTLKENNLKSKMILQVHDELIINTYPDEMEKVKEILKRCMEDAYALSVPLKVDMNTGDSWYDAK